MNFLKKNLFYVILIGLTLVVMIVEIVVMSSSDDSAGGGKKVRSDLLSKIVMLNNQRVPVNDASITQEQDRVTRYSEQAAKVADMSIERNRKAYMELVLRYSDTDTTPVFPFVDETFRSNGTLRATKYYIDKVEELKKKLKYVTQATPEEIKAEEDRIAAQMEAAAPTPVAAPVTPSVAPGSGRSGNRRGGEGTASAPAKTAAELAVQSMKSRKASDGRIYIPEDAIERSFSISTDKASSKDLWYAQVNLWMLSDLLGAINATNDQVLRGDRGQVQKDTVPNSAVKMIRQIKIANGYVVAGAAPAGGTGGPAAPAVPTGPMYPPGFNSGGPGGPGGPGGSGFGPAPVAPAPAAGAAGVEASAGSLGERVSNKDYDVVKYDMVVIMPARHVTALIRNLMDRNYHTITNVEMTEVPDDPASPYYFGAEPVMQVSISGQALLLTSWERGTLETKEGTKNWKYQPLMPVDVLQTLPEAARRPEDTQRLSPVSK